MDEKLQAIERTLIGDIWQNSEIHGNMLYMADELGSRFAGTESEAKAQNYLLSKFKEYGYENAHADPFQYYGWMRGPVTLQMLEPKQRTFHAISLAVSPGGTVRGKVIDVGTGSREEFKAIGKRDIQGNIVLCSSATSPSGERVHRRTKYGYAVEFGAKGFIFMNHNPGRLPPTGSVRPAYRMGGEIPAIGISLETGEMMQRLSKGDTLKVQFRNESTITPKTQSANIIAELPGTSKKDEWIVIGGHFDGHDIAQGAMDNLSGTVVTMELARVLKKHDVDLKRSLRFICFACEEIGVTGSTCYVAKHKEQMRNVSLMMNLELGLLADKKGTKHIAFITPPPTTLTEVFERLGTTINYPLTVQDWTITASDHWPFYMQGVPTVMASAEPSPERYKRGRGWGHTRADTLDKVDHRNLQEGAMVLARLIIRLANQKEQIADHTPLEEITTHLEQTGKKEEIKIQKKWHPDTVR